MGSQPVDTVLVTDTIEKLESFVDAFGRVCRGRK